jgi:hypothetical protein
MIDDLHRLRRSQRALLIREMTELRPSIPVWLAERDDLKAATQENATFLRDTFLALGQTAELIMDARAEGEDEFSTSNALRKGVEAILARIPGRTDIILDVSSLPRVAYLAIMTGLLQRLVPDKRSFEWREAGCSMCVGMNGDLVAPGERCASTSNRNFVGP